VIQDSSITDLQIFKCVDQVDKDSSFWIVPCSRAFLSQKADCPHSWSPGRLVCCSEKKKLLKTFALFGVSLESLTLTKLKNFNRNNRFALIVNFHNCFVKALTEIFQFCRALLWMLPKVISCQLSHVSIFITI